ncbi:MAG: GTPase ObgE [Anaerolineae bacterium]|jgi:GTPase|nr:GTPase ObgE [Anaerolineae bacterium]MBT7072214.1 GTPase ObgE [Anaerolineae bacterium]MBT7323962.1 GTPase ObgE [Anaerolineae bacterium]
MFIDQAEIYVSSGKGGDGIVHFRREKYVPRGGPDGGDGGKGGDVIFEVRTTLNTLSAFRHVRRYIADSGKRGGRNNRYGKSGDDLIILIPPGTIIYDSITNDILGDLTDEGQQLIICKGGRGGRGNTHFKNSRHQVPRTAEKGEPPEEKNIRLELKLIADIGLIGVPNAGKSTLLASLTNAQPKIASYPFTTLIPNLGVAPVGEYDSVVLADIPGLIEGASQGAGLGHEFLRHIQRTRVLIHLLDGMGEDPIADFSQINTELALFDPRLGEKLQIVALNKIDQPEVAERWDEIKKEMKSRGYEIMSISALARTDIRKLLLKAVEKLAETPTLEEVAPLPVYRPETDPNEFEINRADDGGWRISGAAIERAAKMTYWEHYGSIRRFQKIMAALGIEKALRKAGIEEGDTVYVDEYELEWQE